MAHTRAEQARPKVKAAREEGTSPAKAAGALSLQSFRTRSHFIHSGCITPLFCVKTTPALITPEKNDKNSEWHVRVRSDDTQRVYCDSRHVRTVIFSSGNTFTSGARATEQRRGKSYNGCVHTRREEVRTMAVASVADKSGTTESSRPG